MSKITKNSVKYKSEPVKQVDFALNIPAYIFRDRSVSVLEAIVEYLKESQNLTLHQIAKLLNRDDRTIWTCYNRAKKKRK